MKRWSPLLVALPALVIAAAGLAHPEVLTPGTADRWFVAHLVLLPLFPLLAGSVWWLLRGVPGPVAVAARLLAYAYAVLYTLLDAASGVVLSRVVHLADEQQRPGPALDLFFKAGDDIGRPGALCLVVAALLVALALHPRDGVLAVAGGVLVAVGAYALYEYHVFPGRGVAGMLVLAVGLALLAAARVRRSDPAHGRATVGA